MVTVTSNKPQQALTKEEEEALYQEYLNWDEETYWPGEGWMEPEALHNMVT